LKAELLSLISQTHPRTRTPRTRERNVSQKTSAVQFLKNCTYQLNDDGTYLSTGHYGTGERQPLGALPSAAMHHKFTGQ